MSIYTSKTNLHVTFCFLVCSLTIHASVYSRWIFFFVFLLYSIKFLLVCLFYVNNIQEKKKVRLQQHHIRFAKERTYLDFFSFPVQNQMTLHVSKMLGDLETIYSEKTEMSQWFNTLYYPDVITKGSGTTS